MIRTEPNTAEPAGNRFSRRTKDDQIGDTVADALELLKKARTAAVAVGSGFRDRHLHYCTLPRAAAKRWLSEQSSDNALHSALVHFESGPIVFLGDIYEQRSVQGVTQ